MTTSKKGFKHAAWGECVCTYRGQPIRALNEKDPAQDEFDRKMKASFKCEPYSGWIHGGLAKGSIRPLVPPEPPPDPGRGVKSAPERDPKDWPHKCPDCGEPAYIGLQRIECSCPHCENHVKR